MTPTRSPLPITTFYTTDGAPLANGYLLLQINTDVQTPDPGQLGAQSVTRIQLDEDGTITGSPTFWGNQNLLPANSVYLLSAYTESGQQVLYRILVVVPPGTVQGFGLAFGSSFGS
jgi:hypothetical protein